MSRRLIVKSSVYSSKFVVKYGLLELCERSHIVIPSPDTSGGKLEWTDYKCRPFPTRVSDRCDKENRDFCILWTTAGYLDEMGVLMGVVASLSIIFGVTTHSRRRRIWRAVAAFVALHSEYRALLYTSIHVHNHIYAASLQIATFAIVTDAYNNETYAAFEHARPGE